MKHLIDPALRKEFESEKTVTIDATNSNDARLRLGLLQLAGYAIDNRLPAAQAAVKAISDQAAEALEESETAKAIETLQRRHEAAAVKLSEAVERHEQAELTHFNSLSSADDAAVETSRQAVLDAAAVLDIMRREVTTLEELLKARRSELKASRSECLERARIEAIQQNEKAHWAALAKLSAVVAQPEVREALATLDRTATVTSVCGSSAGHLQRNLTLFLSDGHYLP